MAGTTGEIGSFGAFVAHHGAIGNAVAFDVFIATPAFNAFELFFPNDATAVNRCLGIFEFFGNPLVHAQIEV